jgi:putative ABC transport system ATP-binding protein
MIHANQVKFSYPTGGFHLEIADLSIARGTSVAIIGQSGTGKTTLLNLISGVMVPDEGTILTNDAELSGLDDARRRDFRIQHIGLIFQEFELLEYLSVLDNILLPYRISTALKLDRAVRKHAAELAEKVGMADKLTRYVHHLSQGERQRVAICRALLPDPPLILADEPTGNLDPENTDRMLDILFDHVKESGATFVCVTHERHYLDRFNQVIDFAGFRKAVAHA